MLGEPNVRPWVLLYYRSDEKRNPEKYWGDVGRRRYDWLKQSLKANDEIKSEAAEAVSGANTPEEKAAALVRHIWKRVRGLWDTGVTDAERTKVLAKMPKDRRRTAAEVLKSGLGDADERNLLFAAMAISVGLEARPVLLPNRNDILFSQQMTDDYFLDSVDTAVKIGDQWKFYDVGAHLPPGMLSWSEEGVAALVSDPKKPVFLQSPISVAEDSLTQRTAHMALSEDGTLEGDIEASYSGHAAAEHRDKLLGEAEARQQEIFKETVTAVFAQAEVTAIAFQNVDDPAKPLVAKCHLKIPNYGTRTAKRILLQPLLFQFGTTPKFTAAERRYDVVLHYPWKEHDDVSIKFPAGFMVDNAQNPGPLSFGKVGGYTLKMGIRNKSELVIARELTFGQEGTISFPKEAYQQVKAVFDTVHGRDTVALTLRQSEASQ
jgi:hypothetical protein